MVHDFATLLFALGIVSYALAALGYYVALSQREANLPLSRAAQPALVAACVLHAAHIAWLSLVLRRCPVATVEFALSLVALVMVGGFLALARRSPLGVLGVIVAPLGLVLLVAAEFIHAPAEAVSRVPAGLLALHVTVNLLGVGAFLLAAIAGLGYLVQVRRLKTKRTRLLGVRLPGLNTLESAVHRLLLAGFAPLTVGVMTGAVFAHRVTSGGPELLRAALSYSLWLVAGGLVVLGRLLGWSGRRYAAGALVCALLGLAIVLLYGLSSHPGAGG